MKPLRGGASLGSMATLLCASALAAQAAGIRNQGGLGYAGLSPTEHRVSFSYAGAESGKDLSSPFLPVMPSPANAPQAPKYTNMETPDDLRDSLAPLRSKGWRTSAASLVLMGPDGELVNELGLGRWQPSNASDPALWRETRGGAAEDGRSAWYWQKVEPRTCKPAAAACAPLRMLVFLGPRGSILWRDELADLCGKAGPAVLARDGGTVLVSRRAGSDCSVEARSADGSRLMGIAAGERVESASLSDDGRYASVLWGGTGTAMTYSFLDLKAELRHDVPASATLGAVTIQPDGSFTDGRTVLHRFTPEPPPSNPK